MKKSILTVLFITMMLLSLLTPKTVVSYTVSTDLRGRMNFNEGEGLIVNFQNGSLKTLRTGTAFGDPAWVSSINSTYGTALQFVDDDTQRIDIPDHNLLSFDKSGSAEDQPFSISFWINSTKDDNYICSKGISHTAGEKEFSYYLDSESALTFWFYDGDGHGLNFYTGNYLLPKLQWVHIAFSYYGNGKTNSSAGKFYADGSYESSNRGSYTSYDGVNNTSYDFKIGRLFSLTGASNYFDGGLDEFRIWNKSLSAAEVLEVYNNAPYLDETEFPATTTTTTETTTTTIDTGEQADFPLKDGDYFAATPVQPVSDNLEDLLLLSLVVVSSAIAFAIGRRRKK